MITLLNNITSEKGGLFTIGHGRRILLAHCKPEIRIYEEDTRVPLLGKPGGRRKSRRFTIFLCGDMDFTHDAGGEADRYELTADILRDDGIAERFYFHDISLVEIHPSGEWELELHATVEQMRKLSLIAGI